MSFFIALYSEALAVRFSGNYCHLLNVADFVDLPRSARISY